MADLPGSGYSAKPERPYSIDFYGGTTLHFLDALGVKECYLAGGSLGGNLALQLARATVAGSGELARSSFESPGKLRENVRTGNEGVRTRRKCSAALLWG